MALLASWSLWVPDGTYRAVFDVRGGAILFLKALGAARTQVGGAALVLFACPKKTNQKKRHPKGGRRCAPTPLRSSVQNRRCGTRPSAMAQTNPRADRFWPCGARLPKGGDRPVRTPPSIAVISGSSACMSAHRRASSRRRKSEARNPPSARGKIFGCRFSGYVLWASKEE